MSGDAEQEYFSDGITEDIITDLSKVSSLAVISRNSAFVFKGRHVDVPKVARELNVTHVLEGSVRKAGGRVRITAQLVEAASNDHLWAERYDRELQDIFALQDEISAAIVKALQLRLQPAEKRAIEQRGTDSVEAYNLYLMARQLYLTGNEGDARRADAVVRLATRATEIDPAYARAWALRAVGEHFGRFAAGTGSDGGMAAAERAACARRWPRGGARGQGDDPGRRRPRTRRLRARSRRRCASTRQSPRSSAPPATSVTAQHRLDDAIRVLG